jgi:hypothetical protein
MSKRQEYMPGTSELVARVIAEYNVWLGMAFHCQAVHALPAKRGAQPKMSGKGAAMLLHVQARWVVSIHCGAH